MIVILRQITWSIASIYRCVSEKRIVDALPNESISDATLHELIDCQRIIRRCLRHGRNKTLRISVQAVHLTPVQPNFTPLSRAISLASLSPRPLRQTTITSFFERPFASSIALATACELS